MKYHGDIGIYTEEDFDGKLTIYEAQQQLAQRGIEEPSVIVFGKYVGGHRITPGTHTQAVREIMDAVYGVDRKA